MMLNKIKLNPEYLFADLRSPDFHATTNVHGLYNTQQFVLRLSPAIHRKLSEMGSGISTNDIIGLDGAQAMSTYIHETIHWWQHIGSTYGFIFSLNYPIQSHATHSDLRQLATIDGFKKPVVQQAVNLGPRNSTEVRPQHDIVHRIINNHFDLLAFRAFTLGPKAAESIAKEKLFENVGHAFHMTYGHTINILGSTVDKEFKALPHPDEWGDGFRKLTDKKVEGYYYGSPIGLWPLGSYEIFEGQACFIQIQYLSHANGHRLTWEDYRNIGMLHGVYIRAFEEFLRLTETQWPDKVDDPIVGLFLLICDLSINPGSGFPFPVAPNYITFINDVNPGARFCIFSRIIAQKYPVMKQAVQHYSKEEYEMISAELCAAVKEFPPSLIAKTFSGWFNSSGPMGGLRKEYETYKFSPINYPIRHLFSHFLAFQEDKAKRPEFFCWPGAWLAGDRLSRLERDLFEKHSALFVDKEHDDGVFARLQPGRDEATVMATFNEFYHYTMVYDLTNQWISENGAFKYDFHWLQPNASENELKIFLKQQFNTAFGIDIETVEVLS